jgi:hypothetical protein
MYRNRVSILGRLGGLLTAGLLLAACTEVAPPPPALQLVPSRPSDRRVLAGEWEYVDGAVVRLTLDEQGNGRYEWKDGRFETQTLVDHTWHGMWFQKENDRDGGFTVEFSPDFSEGEGRWGTTVSESTMRRLKRAGPSISPGKIHV